MTVCMKGNSTLLFRTMSWAMTAMTLAAQTGMLPTCKSWVYGRRQR